MSETSKPTDRFTIPITSIFEDLDGQPLTEPGPKNTIVQITLGVVLSAAVNSDTKADGVTLDVLERLTLARRFKKGADCTIKIDTCEQLKKLVKAHFSSSPLLAGQALIMLGVEPNEDL